jgi:hypothetical protein
LIGIMAAVDAYCFSRRRLFLLLEREDYPALVQYIEGEIFQKGKYSKGLVQILVNAYFVLSEPEEVIELEQKLNLLKPELAADNALLFGAARILANNPAAAEAFFAKFLQEENPPQEEWLRFYHGFSCLIQGRQDAAVNEFIILVNEGAEPFVIGVSSFFLASVIAKSLVRRERECLEAAKDGKARVNKSLPTAEAWNKRFAKLQKEVHVSILARYNTPAAAWLYGAE